MQEFTREDQMPATAEEISAERLTKDVSDYEKSFAVLCKMIDDAIHFLKATNGKMTVDQLRKFLYRISDGRELALAMSPMEDYSKVNTETFNCRACKKVVWDDGSPVRYCAGCIRSTTQAGPPEISQGTPDQTSATE